MNISVDKSIWIITEANRDNPTCDEDGLTTILFPSEY